MSAIQTCSGADLGPDIQGIHQLKTPITTAADIFNLFFLNYFSEKIKIDISCKLSEQTSHMNCNALFSMKNNNK